MSSLTNTRERVDLLGTTWRNRATDEVAVVWSVSGSIHLIDVDWEPHGKMISDVRPLANDPKYWIARTDEELDRDWCQVKGERVSVGP